MPDAVLPQAVMSGGIQEGGFDREEQSAAAEFSLPVAGGFAVRFPGPGRGGVGGWRVEIR
jgi:hypothetical protein